MRGEYSPALRRHAVAAAEVLEQHHASSLGKGRTLRVARGRLTAGLAMLHEQPGGGFVSRSWDAATDFTTTGVSSAAWLEVRPPGGHLAGWLHVAQLA